MTNSISGKRRGDRVGLGVDALDQHAGEQEIREHDDAAEAEPRRAVERRVDPRMRDAAERRLGPAEAHALPQHAGDLGDVGIGVGVVGAAADDDQQRVSARAVRRHRGGDPVGGGREQLRVDRQIAAEPHLDLPGLAAMKLFISQGRSFLTWLAANSMPGTARIRRAPAAQRGQASPIVGRANSR